MANFIQIIANAKQVEAYENHYPNDSSYNVAANEQEAIEIASNQFLDRIYMLNSEIEDHLIHIAQPEELDAYEIFDNENNLVGWEINSI